MRQDKRFKDEGMNRNLFARSAFLLGSLVIFAVSGCQSTRPSMTSVRFEVPGNCVVNNWTDPSSVAQVVHEPHEIFATQASSGVGDSGVLLASYSESMTVQTSQLPDFCPSCEPQCSMSWCMPTKFCCLDNPCQMPPHYAYPPSHHGYTQFAPYNHSNAVMQKEIARHSNNDPRQPYESDVFDKSYRQVIGLKEEDIGEAQFVPPVGLPSLLDIVNG